MASADRTEDAGLSRHAQLSALTERLAATPYAFDFYQTLRRFEALHPAMPRLGDASRPADEPLRLGQEPALTFAPANLSGFSVTASGVPRIAVRFLGLFGPQGALPTHLTELARERSRSHGDHTLVRFADMFHHRLLSGFYKAWRQAQPTASFDRPASDRFSTYVGATAGLAGPPLAERDAVPDRSKRFHAGHLSLGTRNAEGLATLLASHFRVPVELQAFDPQWVRLPEDQLSGLGKGLNNQLGRSAVVGRRVRDAQHNFQLRMGPMSLVDYRRLLPGGQAQAALRDWVDLYTDRQFGWRVNLVLNRPQVPALQLGLQGQLGWTTWLGKRSTLAGDADDLIHAPLCRAGGAPA